jgi:hypothetical protein
MEGIWEFASSIISIINKCKIILTVKLKYDEIKYGKN